MNSYNPGLFNLLNGIGGKWDAEQKEFIFKNNERMEHKLNLKVPIVKIDQSSAKPLQIYNLKNFNEARNIEKAKKGLNKIEGNFTYPTVEELPEKFSDYWKERLEIEMRARKLSPKTRKVYIYFNSLICRHLQKTAEEINQIINQGGNEVSKFMAYLEKDKKFSASSMNLVLSSLKFFYKNIMKNSNINGQKRPIQDKNLPVILSKEEIKKMMDNVKNPKHKLLLMLCYSSGLRVSEVVALKKEDIDLSRKVLIVNLGKGRKDRNTLIAEKSIKYILDYLIDNEIEKWIFPGADTKRPLTIRTAQRIFDNAVSKAEINKDVSIHNLRHAFATHLLEDGIDIRYIQELLGHTSIRTTERYTHVAKRVVLNITSPLDSIL
jgi:site-specific recombinase XerD